MIGHGPGAGGFVKVEELNHVRQLSGAALRGETARDGREAVAAARRLARDSALICLLLPVLSPYRTSARGAGVDLKPRKHAL